MEHITNRLPAFDRYKILQHKGFVFAFSPLNLPKLNVHGTSVCRRNNMQERLRMLGNEALPAVALGF